MEIKGKVLEIHPETETNGMKYRIVTIEADYKKQILDVYCYNKNSFLTEFLLPNEPVNFDIVLQGIQNETKRETHIVLKKIITPQIKITKDHPLVDCEWLRIDNSIPDKFEKI